jgi:hypothetical protein
MWLLELLFNLANVLVFSHLNELAKRDRAARKAMR